MGVDRSRSQNFFFDFLAWSRHVDFISWKKRDPLYSHFSSEIHNLDWINEWICSKSLSTTLNQLAVGSFQKSWTDWMLGWREGWGLSQLCSEGDQHTSHPGDRAASKVGAESKLWISVKIGNFTWNCKIQSKLWISVQTVKFSRNC